jgi:hypothetical protein
LFFKWFIAYDDKEGKPYFYNLNSESIWELPELSASNSNIKWQFNETKMDPNLPTFNKIRNVTKNLNEQPVQQPFESLNDHAKLTATTNIKYTYKPTEMLQNKFKILKLKEGGKDIK